jgi:hypothetical protein
MNFHLPHNTGKSKRKYANPQDMKLLALLLGLPLTLGAAMPAWADSSADQANATAIAASRTATAAAKATFDTENTAAIARHGAVEPTSTPSPTYTPTRSPTPPPLSTSTAVPPTATPAPTAEPCAEQYSWQLLVDDQGNPITQQNGDEVEGLWQDDQGDQMWAPTTLFCPDSASTPTPADILADTPTATSSVASTPAFTPAAVAPPPPPPAPVAPQIVRQVETVVVLATSTDTLEPTATPAATNTLEASTTPTRTSSPTATNSPTSTATSTVRPTFTPWPSPTALLTGSERRNEWVLHQGHQWLPYDAPIGPPFTPDPRTELAHDMALPTFGVVAVRRLRVDGRWLDVVSRSWLG